MSRNEESVKSQIASFDDNEREIFNVRFSLNDVAMYKLRMSECTTTSCACYLGCTPCSYCTREVDSSEGVLSEIATEMKVGRALLSAPCEPPKPSDLWARLKLVMRAGVRS